MHRLTIVLGLALVYLALTANFGFRNVAAAIVVGLVVTLLVRPHSSSLDLQQAPAAIWAGIQYVVITIANVIQGTLLAARLVLSPTMTIRSGIIAIPSGCDSDLATALSAHAITLSPGEMVIEIDDQGVMYTHTLDVDKAVEYAEQAQALRRDLLVRIFR